MGDCTAPVLVSPADTPLWVGSRYDLVLDGAVAASVGGVTLDCAQVDGLLVCAYTPGAAGAASVEGGRDGCPLEAVGTLDVTEPVGVYPRGDRYMVALYEAQYTDEVATLSDLAAAGVNAVQTYDSEPGLGTWQADAAAPGSRAERVYDGVVDEAPGGELTVDLGRLEARVYRVPDTTITDGDD